MGLALLIRRRQQPSCLLITTLTLLSVSTLTTCTLEYTTQDVSHNKHRTDRTDNNSQEAAVTNYEFEAKDTSMSRNVTDYSVDISTKSIQSIGHLPTINSLTFKTNSDFNSSLSIGFTLLKMISLISQNCWNESDVAKCVRDTVIRFMSSGLYSENSYWISRSVVNNETEHDEVFKNTEENISVFQEIVLKQLRSYDVSVNLSEFGNQVDDSARAMLSWFQPEGSGKSSFLTGFGLGFLAFGLKKLLLPIFLGAQIVKSVLIAMFLPSILGGLGKLVGKGVSTFASASGSSGPSNNNVDDFEFKDNMGFDSGDTATAASKYSSAFTYPETNGGLAYVNGLSAGTLPASALYVPGTAAGLGSINRFQQQGAGNSKVSYESLPTGAQHHYGSYYTRHQQPNKKQDYKVFHNIPSSSLLLTNYDPFYSPLLSRLDSVFKQLGYETETCRERLICAMYNNPAKFAPYSNLVSAQLSRELNELRKPSTDNPEILRFFRYMKAAKDGQDGADCIHLHPGCTSSSANSSVHPPMIKTYQDINKLVQARRLGKSVGV